MSTKPIKYANMGDVRPTTGKIIESLLSTLAPHWEGAKVLDLFAGSGALGLAALDAGCQDVLWVEGHARVARALHHKHGQRGQVLIAILPHELDRIQAQFNLVLADPPYGDPAGPLTLAALASSQLLLPEAIVVVEHHHKDAYLERYGNLERWKIRRFGETALSYYQAGSGESLKNNQE